MCNGIRSLYAIVKISSEFNALNGGVTSSLALHVDLLKLSDGHNEGFILYHKKLCNRGWLLKHLWSQ